MDQPVCETPVTGEYVAKHLKDALGPHAILKSYEAKKIAVGQGFVSNILHLKLTWEQEDHLPKSVVIKVPHVESMHKLMDTLVSGVGETEKMKAMMAQVVTVVHKAECGLYHMFGNKPPVAMPKFYVALPVTEDAPGMIILEDLSEKASVGPRWVDGLTYPQLKAAVTEIAKLHAWSLITPTDWKSKIGSMKDHEAMFRGFLAPLALGYKAAKDKYPDQFGSIDIEKLMQYGNYEFFEKLMNEHHEFMDDVLVHGDCHMNNMMFEKLKDGTVGDRLVALLDFQGVIRGSPVYDIARLLGFSVSYEIRRKHYDEIVHVYYDQVKKLAGDKLTATYDQIRRAMDRSFAFGSLLMIASIPTLMHVLIKSEGEQKAKDEKKVLDNLKANFDDAAEILGI